MTANRGGSTLDKADVGIVLLNYRTPGLVIDCLDSLIAEARGTKSSVVVVDNCSGDDSAEKITAWIDLNQAADSVRLVIAPENGGFASGNNLGINEIDADFYLLLNSDTLLRGDAIANMLSAIGRNPEVGVISPRLEWPDSTPQESCFRFHSPASELISSSGTGLVLSVLSSSEVALRVSGSDTQPAWTSFACIMIRKSVFDQVGLLDDGYFMYYEDVEFCYRARQAGWVIANHPAARVVHLRGGSSPVKSNAVDRGRQPKYYYESRARYFYTVYGRLGLFAANILWTLGWLLAVLRSFVQSRFIAPACQSQWRDIWTSFNKPMHRFVHSGRCPSNESS
jgi:hypothetical protein